jgi:hypothetical protein
MTFKSQLADDLENVFYNTDEFGASAALTIGAGEPVPIKGDFTKEFLASEDVETGKSIFETASTNVASASHGDTLVINSVTYYIIGIHPDEDNLTTTLILSQDPP